MLDNMRKTRWRRTISKLFTHWPLGYSSKYICTVRASTTLLLQVSWAFYSHKHAPYIGSDEVYAVYSISVNPIEHNTIRFVTVSYSCTKGAYPDSGWEGYSPPTKPDTRVICFLFQACLVAILKLVAEALSVAWKQTGAPKPRQFSPKYN